MESETDLLLLIGRRVAERRAAMTLTLDEVASRTGVSRATISKIERGEVHASAVVLDKLASGLGTTLSALFAKNPASPILRREDQPVWTDPASGYVRREVAPAGTGSPVRIVEVDFPNGAAVAFDRTPGRPLDQHVWMLEGEIEIAVEGATHTLRPGDCLHMNVLEGAKFRNESGKPARYAVVIASGALP